MTWIKPSFLWMMERSNWARKPGQEHVLAIRITRAGWEEALAAAILSAYRPGVYRDEWSIEDVDREIAAIGDASAPLMFPSLPQGHLDHIHCAFRSCGVGGAGGRTAAAVA